MFVCMTQRPPGTRESCGPQGSAEFLQKVKDLLQQKFLWGPVRATASGCLGPCEAGPWAVVYPDNVWYRGFTSEDAKEIVEEHLENGRIVERLQFVPTTENPGGFTV